MDKKPVSKDFKGIVRLVGKDLKGEISLYQALIQVKGIGHNLAKGLLKAIEQELGLKESARVGELSEQQLDAVEDLIKEPHKHGVPSFLLNRQKERESGEDKHFLMTDLALAVRQNVEREKTLRTWVGWRHSIGQKVRGQHTRTTGRAGMTVGVLKKAVKAQKAAAATAAQEKGGKKEEKK
jgi:small subunit ribosomal protein S13